MKETQGYGSQESILVLGLTVVWENEDFTLLVHTEV